MTATRKRFATDCRGCERTIARTVETEPGETIHHIRIRCSQCRATNYADDQVEAVATDGGARMAGDTLPTGDDPATVALEIAADATDHERVQQLCRDAMQIQAIDAEPGDRQLALVDAKALGVHCRTIENIAAELRGLEAGALPVEARQLEETAQDLRLLVTEGYDGE